MKILGGHMKSFVLRWAVLFIAANVFGFVVHGLLLQGDYAASPQLLRTQEDANRHFVYMQSKGRRIPLQRSSLRL
jgi:hypothetical protein